jgi:predicted RNA methylase
MPTKTVDVTPAARAVLERASVDGCHVTLPPGQLDRKVYTEVDKVLKAMGGKWSRGTNSHVFAQPVGTKLADALGSGGVVDTKRTNEQFFTPDVIVEQMRALLPNVAGASVLEPSAGDGRLIAVLVQCGAAVVDAVEIDPALAERLRCDWPGRTVRVGCADFLGWANPRQYDAVLMNPPFGNGADMAHVRKAYGHLKAGGTLVSVMSPHWTFASTAKAGGFRDWVSHLGGSWRALADGAFSESGTNVRTGLLVLRKPVG